MKLEANNPIYKALEEAFKAVGRQSTKEETVKQMMEYCHTHYPKVMPRVFVGGPGYGNGAKSYLRSIDVKFPEDAPAPFLNPFTRKLESHLLVDSNTSNSMNLKASARLKASAPVLAAFNPQSIIREGGRPEVVKIIQALKAHVDVRYGQYEEGAGAYNFHIYPSSDSSTAYGGKMFSYPEVMEIAKAMDHISKLGSNFEPEMFLGETDAFIDLVVMDSDAQ